MLQRSTLSVGISNIDNAILLIGRKLLDKITLGDNRNPSKKKNYQNNHSEQSELHEGDN